MSETALSTAASPLDERLVFTDVQAGSRDEVIHFLAARLREHGLVRDSFAQALIDRENVYPTGLPTAVIRVAIPHTDVEHVISPAIAVARLATPVTFGEMGSRTGVVDVDLVMTLAVADKSAQLGLLQALIGMFSDQALMAQLKDAPTAHDLFALIEARVAPQITPARPTMGDN